MSQMKGEERDLCRLPKSCLMKLPTKFLVETYWFSKPVLFMCTACLLCAYCVCLVRLYADNHRAHGSLWLARDPRVSKISHFDRAIKSSVSTLGNKRIKEISSLQRKLILGFRKERNTFCVSPNGRDLC